MNDPQRNDSAPSDNQAGSNAGGMGQQSPVGQPGPMGGEQRTPGGSTQGLTGGPSPSGNANRSSGEQGR